MVIADLPSSDGEAVAKELGETAVFAPTDVRPPREHFSFRIGQQRRNSSQQ